MSGKDGIRVELLARLGLLPWRAYVYDNDRLVGITRPCKTEANALAAAKRLVAQLGRGDG